MCKLGIFFIFLISINSDQLKVLDHLVNINDDIKKDNINILFDTHKDIEIDASILTKHTNNFYKWRRGGLDISFKFVNNNLYLKELNIDMPKYLFLNIKVSLPKIQKPSLIKKEEKKQVDAKHHKTDNFKNIKFLRLSVKNNILNTNIDNEVLNKNVVYTFAQVILWYNLKKNNNQPTIYKIKEVVFAYKNENKLLGCEVLFSNNVSERFYIYYGNEKLYIIDNNNNIIPGIILSINNSLPAKNSLNLLGSRYGLRYHPIYHIWRMHDGIDIRLPYGAKLYSLAPGVVVDVQLENVRGYGRYVEISHNGLYTTRYCHLSTVYAKKGDRIISTDQCIGKVGHSGTATGAHLHLVYLYDGKTVNPINNYLVSVVPLPVFMMEKFEVLKKKYNKYFLQYHITKINENKK